MELSRQLRLFRRQVYSLRAYVPGLRHRHRIESLVGPLGYWEALQRYQLRAVTDLGLQPHNSLLDVGCGPLQGGIAFLRYLAPNMYSGIDRNPLAITVGCNEISRHHLWYKKPTLLVTSSFGDDQLGDAQFDFIWLSQILYYFDEPTLQRLFAMASRRLRPGGILAGDILGPRSDSTFLQCRNPRPPAHTPESIKMLAAGYGLSTTCLGTLDQFGYPTRLNLSHNLLLKVT